MKHSIACGRSKPPPARSSCFIAPRVRSHVNTQLEHTLQGSESLKTIERNSDKTPSINLMMVPTSPKDVSDCISSWLAYLQMLSGLCSAGSRLSHCLSGLIQDVSPNNHIMAAQCQAMWEELVKASTVASSNIKSQVLTALQETNVASSTGDIETDSQRMLNHSQVISSSLVTFINLQYQLCAACCECLGPMAGCNCYSNDPTQPLSRHEPDCSISMLQHCFQRLFPITTHQAGTGTKTVKSPLHVPFNPLQGPQRRWSEAAAQDVGSSGDGDGTQRRWSMPWENSKISETSAAWPGSRLYPKSKLAVPSTCSQDRSRSTTPESVWHSSLASQEELQEVIQLLSCRPTTTNHLQLYNPSPSRQQLPGVTLTSCCYDNVNTDSWSEVTTPGSRRGSNSPHRTSWAVPEAVSHTWSDPEATTPSGTEGCYELSPATLDPAAIASRKSSSSTDSSSSYSLHSRSTTGSGSASASEGGQESARTHLYSIWGSENVPFIKLPESVEDQEDCTTTTPGTAATYYTPRTS